MGATIKVNNDSSFGEMTELFIDGDYVAGWNYFEIPENVKGKLEHMLNAAITYGENKKLLEIQKSLGIKK